MTVDYYGLGQRIRTTRKKKKWTQETLAEKAGISVSFLGHVERGSRKASIETAWNIARVLGITLDYLLPIGERIEDMMSPQEKKMHSICDDMYVHLYKILDDCFDKEN